MPPIASSSHLRPPSSVRSSLNPPNSSHSSSSSSSSSTSTRSRRKGIPYKSPSRSLPPSPSSSRSSSTSTQVINVSLLLRQLARESSSDLDNKRYKPTTSTSATPYTAKEKGKKKAITTSSRLDPALYPPSSVFLPLPQDTYGRGKRSTLSTSRGRSPQPLPSTSTSTSKRIPPVISSAHLHPPSPRPSSRSMPRTLSPPTTAADASLVVVGSPLARSFTSDGKGEIREVFAGEGRRSRNPSVGGSSTNSVGVGANQGVSVWA